jgi:hypothetical protein
LRFILAHKFRQKRVSGGADEANRKFTDFASCGSLRSAYGYFRLSERTHRLNVKNFAFRSDFHNAASAREELQPEFTLQVRNGLTNRRLRYVKMPRGFAISLPLHHGREISKMPQFHTVAPIDRSSLSI